MGDLRGDAMQIGSRDDEIDHSMDTKGMDTKDRVTVKSLLSGSRKYKRRQKARRMPLPEFAASIESTFIADPTGWLAVTSGRNDMTNMELLTVDAIYLCLALFAEEYGGEYANLSGSEAVDALKCYKKRLATFHRRNDVGTCLNILMSQTRRPEWMHRFSKSNRDGCLAAARLHGQRPNASQTSPVTSTQRASGTAPIKDEDVVVVALPLHDVTLTNMPSPRNVLDSESCDSHDETGDILMDVDSKSPQILAHATPEHGRRILRDASLGSLSNHCGSDTSDPDDGDDWILKALAISNDSPSPESSTTEDSGSSSSSAPPLGQAPWQPCDSPLIKFESTNSSGQSTCSSARQKREPTPSAEDQIAQLLATSRMSIFYFKAWIALSRFLETVYEHCIGRGLDPLSNETILHLCRTMPEVKQLLVQRSATYGRDYGSSILDVFGDYVRFQSMRSATGESISETSLSAVSTRGLPDDGRASPGQIRGFANRTKRSFEVSDGGPSLRRFSEFNIRRRLQKESGALPPTILPPLPSNAPELPRRRYSINVEQRSSPNAVSGCIDELPIQQTAAFASATASVADAIETYMDMSWNLLSNVVQGASSRRGIGSVPSSIGTTNDNRLGDDPDDDLTQLKEIYDGIDDCSNIIDSFY